jgi:hypothetical protein
MPDQQFYEQAMLEALSEGDRSELDRLLSTLIKHLSGQVRSPAR